MTLSDVNPTEATDLLNDPAVKEGTLIRPIGLGGAQQGVLVREDGTVLGDDVKQMHSTRLNCLCDVVVGCNQSMPNSETFNQSASSTFNQSTSTTRDIQPISIYHMWYSTNRHLAPVIFNQSTSTTRDIQPISIYHMWHSTNRHLPQWHSTNQHLPHMTFNQSASSTCHIQPISI